MLQNKKGCKVKKIKIDSECQFLKDLDKKPQKDFNGVTLGIYNLITVKGHLKLWTKDIKPYRGFKIKEVRKYFGITGNAKKLLYKLEVIFEILRPNERLKNNA